MILTKDDGTKHYVLKNNVYEGLEELEKLNEDLNKSLESICKTRKIKTKTHQVILPGFTTTLITIPEEHAKILIDHGFEY